MVEFMRERLSERQLIRRQAQYYRTPGPAGRGGHRLTGKQFSRRNYRRQPFGQPACDIPVTTDEEPPRLVQPLLPFPGQVG